MILITSQSPVAFAGACQDEDGDGYYHVSAPSYCGPDLPRDCDDTDPNVYPGHGVCPIKIETDVSGGVVVGPDDLVIISNRATVDGDLQVNGGTVVITESSTIKGNI